MGSLCNVIAYYAESNSYKNLTNNKSNDYSSNDYLLNNIEKQNINKNEKKILNYLDNINDKNIEI